MWDDEVEGDVAEVHQSLIEPQRFVGAPYRAGLANAATAFALMFGAQFFYWGVVAVVSHVTMWLTTRKDIFALEQLREYCQYAPYYGV